jgi:hypothetical protein
MTETKDATAPANHERECTLLSQALDDSRRAALALLGGSVADSERALALDRFHRLPAEQALRVLAEDRVDQVFLRAALATGQAERLPAGLVEILKARRLAVAADALRQRHALALATSQLDEMGVPHVVFKGALMRKILYAKPYLRPAVDVDLLVAPADAPRSVARLQQRGFALALAAHSDTHEAWLSRQNVGIDLHWSLLRPGRMRVDITDEVLAGRVREGDLWRPDDTHLTVAMLVHPAITDYVTGKLISAVDMDRWLRKADVPWEAVIGVLSRIGLRTAAWAMLFWTHALFATPVPEDVFCALAPSLLRQKYIESWLSRHPARLYQQHPHLVRGAFSLALQDRPTDMARALWMLVRKPRLAFGAPNGQM